jgi:ArsR family transcriptional regulator, lead/cadmium/zinc/bismuth-responsive transcriptional repressor
MFRAAGDAGRLRLLEELLAGPCCVSDLAAHFAAPLPTISQQLRILHQAGLVTRTRDGKHVYYALTDRHVRSLLQNALDHGGEGRR